MGPTSLAAQRVVLLRGIALWLVIACVGAIAQEDDSAADQFVVDVELQTVDDLRQLLERADQLLAEGKVSSDNEPAVVFVLHGPVLRSLLRNNYLDNKATVDRAASLSALGVVEMKACRTWLTVNDVDERDLQPFVTTVSYGPEEVQRLVRVRNYIYF